MGTQKNRFNEKVLLRTQNMLKLMGKKFTILRCKFFVDLNLCFHDCVLPGFLGLCGGTSILGAGLTGGWS